MSLTDTNTTAGRILERVTTTSGLTTSGLVLLAVTAGAWSLGRFIGGRPLYLIAYGLLVVLALAFVVARTRALPLEGRRSESRPRLAEGETVTMEVALTSSRRMTTFVLEEKVPTALGDNARLPIATIEPADEFTHSYKLTCRRRGVYQLGPLVAKWGDPLGLTRRESVLAGPVEILVHPSVEGVEDRPLTRMFEDPPIRPPLSRPWPQGLEFYGMRQYAPGDDVRRVVWRAFARTRQLLVREAEQGITDKVVVLLDQDTANHTSGEVSGSFEAGVRVAASLGVRHLRDGFAVTLEGSTAALTTPLRGAQAQLSLLDALARVERDQAALADAIMRLVTNGLRGAHLVVVTPRLSADAAARLDLILQRGTSVLVAALLWGEESAETLARAASLGAQVVEIRPRVPLAVAFRRTVGAGMGAG